MTAWVLQRDYPGTYHSAKSGCVPFRRFTVWNQVYCEIHVYSVHTDLININKIWKYMCYVVVYLNNNTMVVFSVSDKEVKINLYLWKYCNNLTLLKEKMVPPCM